MQKNMSDDADYLFALDVQNRLYDQDNIRDSDVEELEVKNLDFKVPRRTVSKYHDNQGDDFLNRTQNLVHPDWETLDPTPDILSLFNRFDAKFFQSRLSCVTIEWSKRMFSCTGICYQRRSRLGMAITIRLSEPLLKLRARKDLVETMLHEMIHAYCFVLNIREGNGGHGPNFKKIMHTINKVAGTNITVYHTFYDEVNLYKQHWWRCNGICQERSPFFGYVKRTCNRAPGPNDQWWAQHLHSCGGTFLKFKEPDKKPKNEKVDKATAKGGNSNDLRKYFSHNTTILSSTKDQHCTNIISDSSGISKSVRKINSGTLQQTTKKDNKQTNENSISKIFPPTSYPGLSSDSFDISYNDKKMSPLNGRKSTNVIGFRNLNTSHSDAGGGNSGSLVSDDGNFKIRGTMTGRGYTLESSTHSFIKNAPTQSPNGEVDRKHLRSLWSNRFGGNKEEIKPTENFAAKRIRVPWVDSSINVDLVKKLTIDSKKKKMVLKKDDDVFIIEPKEIEIIELLSESEDEDFQTTIPVPKKIMTSEDRQKAIKQDIIDETADLNLSDDDIILIDDEYDDNEAAIVAASELADTSIIDEFFGEDTLMKEFQNENDVVPSGSRYHKNPKNDVITCPICFNKMQRQELEEHLNGCTGITIKIMPPKRLPKTVRDPASRRRSEYSRNSVKDILRKAGYTESQLTGFTSSRISDELNTILSETDTNTTKTDIGEMSSQPNKFETERQRRQRNLFKTTRQCPCCGHEFEADELFDHLDDCPGTDN